MINNNFYIGKHSTNDLNDGYLGSGYHLKNAIMFYGVNNFKKEILCFFDSEDEAYAYEKEVVTLDLVNDSSCYNIITGGRNCIDFYRNDYYAKKRQNTFAQKRKKALELGVSYGTTKESAKKALDTKKNSGIFDKWSIEWRGYNNPEFKYLWENIYKKDADKITWLLRFTDIPDRIIVKDIYKKNVKLFKLINYYKYIGLLPNKIQVVKEKRFWCEINDNHKTTLGNIRVMKIDTQITDFGETKYQCLLFYKDFFNCIPIIQDYLKDLSYSDSWVKQSPEKKYPVNLLKMVEYFNEIGVIKNIHIVEANVNFIQNGKPCVRKAPKTVFEFDFSAQNKILIDKELNIYGIDKNGRPFQKSKLGL
jgi:hypothetical protein